jgi:RNA polymerase sigma factor (sigma-70 family)
MRVPQPADSAATRHHQGLDPLSDSHGLDQTGSEPDYESAFVDLFARAERVARRVVGDAATAEDIAAETLTRALVRWSRIKDHPGAWVTAVATNLALDTVRRRGRKPPRESVPSRDESSESRVTVAAALRRLSAQQRTVLVLRYMMDLTEDETARILGLAPATVKTHAQRGLAVLRRRLGPTSQEVPDVIRRSSR